MPCAFYISAAHKSSGKTIVSLGLAAAFKQQSLAVQAFKKGPDYIDSIWLTKASGNPCYNLDFYNMSADEIQQCYAQHAALDDISIVEGNKGLFDGMNVAGGDANADLAKLLNIPVILVMDSTGITRGIAPLVNGYQAFDKDVRIAGIILNKIAGDRHQSKLIQALEYYTDIPVLGSIRRSSELLITERHLGLMPANECEKSQMLIAKIATHITEQVDLDKIMQLNQSPEITPPPTVINAAKTMTVAVAKDRSFGFYYPDDIAEFARLGVELIYFDTLKDSHLPKADGLFIGGGFPEMQLQSLGNNQSLMADIKTKIQAGLPTYAECGGLMYLSRQITFEGKKYPLVGVIEADTIITDKPIGRGYVQLVPTTDHPWQGVANHIYAHEFHYSKLENIANNTHYAYQVKRGMGINGKYDGILTDNLLATYTHLRSVGNNNWVQQFVDFIQDKL